MIERCFINIKEEETNKKSKQFLFGAIYHYSLIDFLADKNNLWRRQRHPTPVFLPGKSHGQRSLVGCRLWGCTGSDMTEATQQQQQQHITFNFKMFQQRRMFHRRILHMPTSPQLNLWDQMGFKFQGFFSFLDFR